MSLRHRMLTPMVVASLTILFGAAARGQAITVQQPVVQQFGLRTVVSVPDRGAALLGSVGSAAESRRWNGPLPFGSSIGRQIAHSSLSVHVTIHDYAAMDAALLATADAMQDRDRRTAHDASLSGMAARAREQLLRQHRHIPPTP